ncbi:MULTISPECIES: phage tail sheath C-terminal domain-containing protein [unclassified Flavobacterium]|jgi:phage tail sheath protein FI|uniref:phage tail sheath C-terminal domain-containing protein n=1 Tax=unclassified Flavobacterium TaxID=196869 RepID=UPI00034C1E00|nr:MULTISPECIES: phage tail sheath C-terminal domain-containing protein [unclassified Flavobacterium]URC14631.1 phage tail protein [Flavobacterium sp. B183]
MATTYKTPGVYVEEIVKFPPSVAQVETAIPAFIGYTEKATNKINGDLKLKPTRITSLLEYERFFGFAKPETTISVTINDVSTDNGDVRSIIVDQPTSKQPFLMYYSLQLFFANGGGPCYIVSVGRYGNDLDDADSAVTAINNSNALKSGLAEIEKVDEPTLLLFPDATKVSGITITDYYGLYNDALTQCQNLQDRFTLIDTLNYDESSPTDTNIDDLRNKVSSEKDTIKYGAAYYPHLETILDYAFDASKIVLKHYSYTAKAYDQIAAGLVPIEDPATGITATVTKLVSEPVAGDIAGQISDLLLQMYSANPTGFDLGGTFASSPAKKTAFLNKLNPLLTTLETLSILKSSLNDEANAAISTISDEDPGIANTITSNLNTFNLIFTAPGKIDAVYKNLKALKKKIQDENTDPKLKKILLTDTLNFDTELKKLVTYTPLNAQTGITGLVNNFSGIAAALTALITAIKSVNGKDLNNGELNGRKLSALEAIDNATYNKILTEIYNLPITLPPSSAIAGIYARVDKDRGVWKAPANVSLNYVIKPTVKITNNIQDGLNVDTVAGKSINAIRSFTGKGTLVWGSRTLAGNDNEWRYVPVRRFFNMAEESIKKATEQFVFEPNDANTWIRVRAMIENFLILQWRAGALAGAKPEQAFYVRIGLGQTMSAIDILEGRLIVEIGMAVVRPAEFIILRFSHKMQES